MTELILVRHGETIWNQQGRQQGHLDSELSALGKEQAGALADRLAKEQFHHLYSSDLMRARCTAEYVSQKTGHRIVTDVRLRERNLGIFQGLTIAEVKQRYSQEYSLFDSGDPDYVIPQGESTRAMYERVTQCVAEIAARHNDQRIVIVTHGGVLSRLFRWVLEIPLSAPRRYKLYNASINTFFISDGLRTLGVWGDTHHLAGIGTSDDW